MRSVPLFAILVALAPVASWAAPGEVHTVLNAATLRAGPGSQYPGIGAVTARSPVPLVEVSRQGGWIETDRGWVWGQLVTPGTGAAGAETGAASLSLLGPSAAPPADVGRAGNRMVVSTYASDLRQAPRSDAKADLRLSEGVEVIVSKIEGEWARVAFGDAAGWVRRSDLKPWEPPKQPAPSPQRGGKAKGTPL